MSFQEAFVQLLGHEGGYSNLVADKGGETNWGISKRSYPNVDIQNLTMNQAGEIYKRDFWDRMRCDELPEKLAFQLFDAGVNSGIRQAVTWVQRAVKADADGVLGPKTLAAIKLHDESKVLAHFNGHRLEFMADLDGWKDFGRGWARRIASNLKGT